MLATLALGAFVWVVILSLLMLFLRLNRTEEAQADARRHTQEEDAELRRELHELRSILAERVRELSERVEFLERTQMAPPAEFGNTPSEAAVGIAVLPAREKAAGAPRHEPDRTLFRDGTLPGAPAAAVAPAGPTGSAPAVPAARREEWLDDSRFAPGAELPPLTEAARTSGRTAPADAPEPAGPVAAILPAGPSDPPRELIRDVFRLWAERRDEPPLPAGLEVGALRYADQHRASDVASPTFLFEDCDQVGEFVRFSRPGADEALVLPHPEATPHLEFVRLLFPGIDLPTLQDPHRLGAVEPVTLRRNGKHWERPE